MKKEIIALKKAKAVADSDMTTAEQLIGEIMEIVDEDDLPVAAENFVESVRDKTEGIDATINEYRRVTDNQLTALENMRDGLLKWKERKQ